MHPASATAADPPPYADLDPQRVIDLLERLGLQCDGRVLALNSYENRVYRVGIEDGSPLVAKFYRPRRWSDAAIREEHAFTAELAEAGVDCVPPLPIAGDTLHALDGHRVALFPLRGGRAPEPGDKPTLQSIGRSLGLLHAIGDRQPFRHRPLLDVETFGDGAVARLLASPLLPVELQASVEALADELLDRVDDAFEAVAPHRLRLHGDCHLGNLLWRDGHLHIVDLDDCLSGPAVQDLWMLVSGEHAAQRQQVGWLLEGYRQFREFDRAELRLIEPLRTLRLLHFHAWVAERWHDPAFPAAFPWFAERRHWERFVSQLQEQLAELQETTPWTDDA
jgi:Ser/Thr protein kinase RdoA (MazF antagonist)